jgi:hypothetical protein
METLRFQIWKYFQIKTSLELSYMYTCTTVMAVVLYPSFYFGPDQTLGVDWSAVTFKSWKTPQTILGKKLVDSYMQSRHKTYELHYYLLNIYVDVSGCLMSEKNTDKILTQENVKKWWNIYAINCGILKEFLLIGFVAILKFHLTSYISFRDHISVTINARLFILVVWWSYSAIVPFGSFDDY